MTMFSKTIRYAVDTMEEGERIAKQLLLDEQPHAMLTEVKKKYVEAKEVEYYKFEVTLEFISETRFRKGEYR